MIIKGKDAERFQHAIDNPKVLSEAERMIAKAGYDNMKNILSKANFINEKRKIRESAEQLKSIDYVMGISESRFFLEMVYMRSQNGIEALDKFLQDYSINYK